MKGRMDQMGTDQMGERLDAVRSVWVCCWNLQSESSRVRACIQSLLPCKGSLEWGLAAVRVSEELGSVS